MPKLKPVVLQMRVSAEDGARIQQAAMLDNRTVSAWLRDVALRALDAETIGPDKGNSVSTRRRRRRSNPDRHGDS